MLLLQFNGEGFKCKLISTKKKLKNLFLKWKKQAERKNVV